MRETVPPLRWLVLDAEAVNDIDTSGARALAETVAALQPKRVTFALSRVHARVHELLERYGLLEAIGEGQLFRTNREAVAAFERAADKSPESTTDSRK